MASEQLPSPGHLEWMIKGRAKNQQAALDLYELMKDHRQAIEDKRLSSKAQDLAAVAFSLWRAVFLADRTGKTEAKMKDAEAFIGKMLTDNAIAFTQDRTAREWTFLYYLDNALYRLRECAEKWPDIEPSRPPQSKRTIKSRWEYANSAFRKAVKQLTREVKANREK
jgi:hypothetical protein